ncbi:MAG: hypothetical protein HGA45_23765 [Chloroflexales bacterium]|nr:hypothetical protein [Chloroflexales bacterium]
MPSVQRQVEPTATTEAQQDLRATVTAVQTSIASFAQGMGFIFLGYSLLQGVGSALLTIYILVTVSITNRRYPENWGTPDQDGRCRADPPDKWRTLRVHDAPAPPARYCGDTMSGISIERERSRE